MHPRERPHRLPAEAYLGEVRVAITCALEGRRPVFLDPAVVAAIRKRLVASGEKESMDILLYCFMPDHLHAIVKGRRDDSNFLNFMKRFKQSSGFWLKQNLGQASWDGDYYDHVIRDSNDFAEQCRYIVGNPARAGLVEDPLAYPFTGSAVCSLDELLGSL